MGTRFWQNDTRDNPRAHTCCTFNSGEALMIHASKRKEPLNTVLYYFAFYFFKGATRIY